jgi:site-specific DNA recombinase
VSTEEQAEAGTVKAQLDFLYRFCELYAIPVAGAYVDDGISGTIPLAERPEGRRLLDDARSGAFTQVLVYRVSRLARSLKVMLDAHNQLDALGITIRSGTEPFDSSTPIGRFMFQLLGSMAELDRASTLEQLNRGRDRVAATGVRVSAWLPYGYDLDGDGKLVPSARCVPGTDITEADVARDLFVRIAAGSTLYAEAARLNALGVPAVRRTIKGKEAHRAGGWALNRVQVILYNPIYKGVDRLESRFGRVETRVPALVDPELWDAAHHQLIQNRRLSRTETASRYLLRGLITCEQCGSGYAGRYDTRQSYATRQYRCNGRAHPGSPRINCLAATVRAEWLESAVWADCRAFILNPGDALDEAREQLRARLAKSAELERERPKLLRQIAEKDQERERILTMYRRNTITMGEAERQLEAIRGETTMLRDELAAMSAQDELARAFEAQVTDAATILVQLRDHLEAVERDDDWETKRRIVELLVSRISVASEGAAGKLQPRITIRYTFGKPATVEPSTVPAAVADTSSEPGIAASALTCRGMASPRRRSPA